MPRQRIDIDSRQVESLTQLGSPASEIADFLGVSESTIRRRFRKILSRARAIRRMKLRSLQWEQAREGSVPMLIFLGKDELGQGQETQEPEMKIIVRRAIPRIAESRPAMHPDESPPESEPLKTELSG